MAFKFGKLDAICARLKKTSAVDVKATSQNGLEAEVTAVSAEGHTKDEVKNATTNNNEETVTDLNEAPSSDVTAAAVAEDEEASSLSIPASTPVLTSTPNKQPSGSSGRRKSRKAAKPRIISQIQELFDSDLYEEEGEGENSAEGFAFDGQNSPYLHLQTREEGSDTLEDEGLFYHGKKQTPSQDSTGQYSVIQPGSPNSGQLYESSTSVELSRSLSGVPLDLSTSKTSDESVSEPVSAESSANSFAPENTADSLHNASTIVSALTAAHAASAVSHNAEAKVLADYAKNTMNELLSIYGFGGAGLEGVDKALAQKHFENLASLKVAVDASSKLPTQALERIAPTLLNGRQAVHKDVGTSASSLSVEEPKTSVVTETKLNAKPDGNQIKLKLQNSLKGGSGKPSSSGSSHKVTSSDYNKYIKKFHNGIECGGSHCKDLGYRDHYHCHDCNFKVFIKKEEMIRHYKWHKKRDESLQHGFMRYSPLDDCGVKFGPCTHNGRQTHYHCVQPGCDKVYISTSDVQMHANYHRKDSAIIQEGFQRFRATEDCGTTTCSFYGQRTTHFHCRRASCNFTFKNKADMEKHKSYHQKDEILGRDGFKKFMKYEHCTYSGCRFSKISNHIHCIRPGCTYVLHSTAQLYSHKRKHERREFESLYRTFRQAQRTTGLPGQPVTTPAVAVPIQTAARQLTSVTNLPRTVVSTEMMTIPVQAIGEPMVAQRVGVQGQVVQPLTLPIQLGTTTATMLARTTTSTMIAQPMVSTEAVKNALAVTTSAAVTTTSTPSQAGSTNTADNTQSSISQFSSIKQEPESEQESDSETGISPTKSTGTSTVPFAIASKLDIKGEKLNDSLTLPIPRAPPVSGAVKQEAAASTVSSKVTADASIGVDTSIGAGQAVTLVPRVRKVGAPEKRERDETWKNYLIRYTANDPCNSRCQLLYKDHYHCKIPGCQVLFRSKDGVREHAKFHDLQDRITPMVYNRYEELQVCPQNCELSLKEKHYHCNWTGCNHVITNSGPTFARLEHYRIHEYAKAAAGKNYRIASGQSSKAEDYSQRRRGRPPKYPRMDVPLVPKVDLSAAEIKESTRQFTDGETIDENAKVVNGFRRFEEDEPCPDDQCMYYKQAHYHCGRPRCHTATDRVDVLNLHAKDFHSFVTILENFEFFDRNVNCRRAHCHNNQVNRHYHCIRPRCDYSFVRHSTMTQHDKKHGMTSTSTSPLPPPAQTTPATSTRVAPIQWVKRPDGKAYIPIIPAIDPNNKNIVKAAGTFYPLSGLSGAVALTPAPAGIVVGGQQLATSTLTLTIPANLVTATIPIMAQTLSTTTTAAATVVPVITTGNIINTAAGTAAGSAPPLTVLLQQKSGNGVPQPSWSSMRQSMHFSVQASCGRPFCKLKKKDHYHCLECNQAFSDPLRLRSHISKHGVKFRKLEQGMRSIRPVPVTVLNPSNLATDVGLDLSTGKSKDGAGENPEEQDTAEVDAQASASEDQGFDDEEDSRASSSTHSISRMLPREEDPSSPSMDASELNEDGALVIDEDAEGDTDQEASLQHSLDSSMDGRGDEEDNEATSENALDLMDTSMSSIGSATSSRRSSRKRTATMHADFINSDDAALAKQMKLKLSGPIPSSVSAGSTSRQVPDGFIRFHCSNDCGYYRCAYRQTVTHFHCLRPECGYGFSDKSRIIQHRLRHERIDKLMGDDFQQFRATVSCWRADCEFAEKASHFHCQKCAFVCADSSKVLAHRKYHTKMDNISNNGFKKFTGNEDCGNQMCTYCRKQTHYHCTHDSCNHAVLGPAQMAPHKLKHACHDV